VRLGISANTVRGHIKLILKKLECHSVIEAVLAAQERGLL
jgi:DNA-binding NarL/FixJ family response regulator